MSIHPRHCCASSSDAKLGVAVWPIIHRSLYEVNIRAPLRQLKMVSFYTSSFLSLLHLIIREAIKSRLSKQSQK